MIPSYAVSVALVGIFGWHLWLSVRSMRLYDDVRALRYVITAGMLFLGSAGLAIATYALRSGNSGQTIQALSVMVGFSQAILVIGGLYLVISWRRQ